MQHALDIKDDPDHRGPIIVQQLGFNRKPEYVDYQQYRMGIICECGEVRFVMPKNYLSVLDCKPCAARKRRMRARRSMIARGKLGDSRLQFSGNLIVKQLEGETK